ncbi:flagellar hook-associated protein 1 FlgK [Pseudomonas sp. ok272]|uniref:flagellar hook-associated protein FlgK n=1 Tax=unclassified Pseudomonas TaxID=196821 RepID=UPI0008C38EB7|nr:MULTISPECIES: flagellar hook-associated protein FlgK [unclassified Pseudomonas]SEM62832.1 flagellar hook-associated protein 1 FlgK [Pseudomonas sp. ok272]SFM47309.1 flagellar hook-associated protein 1 FlgK [Pseudomonas sp. ok602]
MSILNQIAYSGVRAAQIAISTTGQNIANVNTPGFSRLNTVLGSLSGQGGLSIGGGVEVTSIRRLSNDFQNQQLWRATTEQNYYNNSQQYLTSLEGLMAGEGSSISVGLDRFFAAISEASASPSSIALRQQIISESKNLSQRFNGLNSNIDAQINALHEQRSAMVTEVNGLTANIALLNQKIVEAQSVGGDTSALRDHREGLVTSLSQYASLRINEVPDGSLSVALANGQPLVAGTTAGQLQVTKTVTGEQEMALAFAGTSFPLKQDGFGGAFGGLYEVEYNNLRPSQDALHDMASELAKMINDTLATGFDLAGNPGRALFTYNASSTSGMLTVTDLAPEDLAFSSAAGETGNNEVLLALLQLKGQTINVGGSRVTLNDAYAGLLGQVASASRQNQADLKSASAVTQQAQSQRDSVSAVSLDEEAVNLMTYQQAYQANMKVISTANQLFDEMLASF